MQSSVRTAVLCYALPVGMPCQCASCTVLSGGLQCALVYYQARLPIPEGALPERQNIHVS